MPSGTRKRRQAKRKLQAHIVSEEGVHSKINTSSTEIQQGVSETGEDDSSINENSTQQEMNMGNGHMEAVPLISDGHMEAVPLIVMPPGEDYSSINENSTQQGMNMGNGHMEAAPLISDGHMSNKELHVEEEENPDEKTISRHACECKMDVLRHGVGEGNTLNLEHALWNQQDTGAEGTCASEASTRDVKTFLQKSDVSDLALPGPSNEDPCEGNIKGCVSSLHIGDGSLCNNPNTITNVNNIHVEQILRSVDEENCQPPCPPSSDPWNTSATAMPLHEENCNVNQLVLAQSSPPIKDHANHKRIQQLSLRSRWWGCCGIFDLLLHKG